MDYKILKTQLLSEMTDRGCTDSLVSLECVTQAIDAGDILGTFSECLSYALSLYQARMWGRKKSNDLTLQEQRQREKKFSEDAPCLAPVRKRLGEDEIRVGNLILKKKK